MFGIKSCAVFVFSSLFVFLLAAASAQDNPLQRFQGLQGNLDIAGGTAHIPVMKEAAMLIMKANPNIRITVAGGGSGVGIQKVGEGLVNIGNTGRAPSKDEIEKYGLKSFPFAIDGVAVAVHPKNPVSDLTPEKVQAIYAGAITSWKDLGGPNAPINLYTRDEASGTREVFWKKLLKKGPVAVKANVVPSNGAMKVAIAQDVNAIGYLGIGHVDKTVKAVKLNGVEPTQENAKSSVYPVVRQLYMNTKGDPTPLAQVFIDFILSPEGAQISRKHGYIPLQ
ncbi:phosphate ABC transporter substrate-binding protein [Desulfobacca acetoxidans]|uniref:Phosphate-binding protein n=1 Tax=Desulfobacca acetoxidans (strain ATCC 700848 / DSM 11109 / ASRB2) TaxID=880072 RepID=F2NG50_DESAR|nr:phosphate ABC transporter substrate-binding protein [Desulfobacca acetoxidans]AEB08463.1 phosphate binding protein [Desulfobacca acetoxidans DSM 11109]HAY21886.1 phosphate ABC transporter substrate-binding protein [Desulfobacterales bacterium]